MLVITRRSDEQFFIGDNVVIKIVSVDGGRVRVGIEAPGSLKIFREEMLSAPEAAAIVQAAKGGK